MVKPLEDARDLSRLAYGFMASKALFCALHLDVFSRLDARSQTGGELAAATGVAEHRMQTLEASGAAGGLARQDCREATSPENASTRALTSSGGSSKGRWACPSSVTNGRP
jgi:hypothetical protein